MKKLFFVMTILLAGMCRAGDISPLLVPAAGSVPAGSSAQFWLVYLNSGSGAATIHIPERVAVRVESPGGMHDEVLIREDQLATRNIEAGGFCRVKYSMAIPADMTGQLIVKLRSPDATPVLLTATATSPQPIAPTHLAETPPTAPVTTPAATTTAARPVPAKSNQWRSDPLTESFANRFSTYQPVYFIAGSRPTAKFQISFKYQIFDDDGAIARKYSPLDHLYFAYSQTSFWDWVSPSSPFTDNSYRPEVMFSYDNILRNDSTPLDLSKLGLQAGYQHESNGRDKLASRSMNLLYIRPILTWDIDKANDIFISIAPRIYTYIFDLSDNPDMAQYRGYGDVRLVIGQRYGFQAALFARVGEDFNKGSLELDLSQPLRPRSRGDLDLYLYGQFFTGYGEQLIQYNKSTTTFRIGLAFVR